MIKLMFVSAAVMLAAPVLAQEAPAAPPADAAAPAATPAAAPMAALPKCTAKVQDSCDQSKTTERNALSGEQADARDARNGGTWTPNAGTEATAAPRMSKKRTAAKRRMVKTTTTVTETTPAAAPQ